MSTKGKQLEATIKFKGTVDPSLMASVAAAKKAVGSFRLDNLNNAFNRMDNYVNGIARGVWNIGKTAAKTTLVVGSALAGAGAMAAKKAVEIGNEYESAFAGVKKTVEGTTEQLSELRENIIRMSTDIPSSVSEIAGVAEAAGQLGVPVKDIEEFTETMIKLGTTTNLSAEEAATALARFTNITGMDGSNYEKLGATITDLGNNFATTEAEIIAMATRLASAGDIVGMTESDILGLSTAMSAVGIASEKGGSTMSKVLRNIQTQVETNGKKLGQYASVAGMGNDEFSSLFRNNPVKALTAFISGLNNTERNGQSAIGVLNEMGLTEVRMSGTLLSLANASDMMNDAINRSNKAWERGTALTKEANERYRTLESRTTILKNNFAALAVGAYDQIRNPLGEGMEWLIGKVEELRDYLLGPTGIRKWINEDIPKIVKKCRDILSVVKPIASTILDFGGWLLEHPDFLAGAFTALGTALVTYKIASNVTHLVSAFKVLASNPLMLGITGVATVIGLIAGHAVASKIAFEELKRLDLERHFGNISLSLEEIEKTADHLLNGNGNLTRLNAAFTALGDADRTAEAVRAALDDINRENWKVSVGMELSGTDADNYRTAIENYVAECNRYITDSRYAVSLSLGLFTDNMDIAGSVNSFYANSYTEMDRLGKELAELVNQAFADDILNMDDSELMAKILEKQKRMAELQSKLATGQTKAKVSLLSQDYSGGQLTSDSFLQLKERMLEIEEESKQTYATEYITAMGALETMRDSGTMIPGGYDAAAKEIMNGYQGKLAELGAITAETLTGIIIDTYGGELDKVGNDYFARNEIAETFAEKLDHLYIHGAGWDMAKYSMIEDIPEEIRENVNDLMSGLPSVEELERIKENLIAAGHDITSDSIAKVGNAINSMNTLSALAGDAERLWAYMLDKFSTDKDYQAFVRYLQSNGMTVPGNVLSAVNGSSGKSGYFAGIAEKVHSLTGHANGGIFNTPHIAAFCENGAESVIPLDGTANALSLWRKTGQLLGMGSLIDGLSLGSPGAEISYSPTLVFNGGSPDRADVESALRTSQDEFEIMMEKYLRKRSRLAF